VLLQLSLAVLAVCLGLLWNNGWKFVRAKPTDVCARQVLDIFSHASHHCCVNTASPMHTVMCQVAFSEVNRMLSDLWAWVVPLLPWAVGFLLDLRAVERDRARRWNRLGLYLAIMFVRTFILYVLLNQVEVASQTSEKGSCWYSEFTRDGL